MEASKKNFIEIRWIKAHVGHTGNEKADELAKKGAQNITEIESDTPRPPKSVMQKKIKNSFLTSWNESWIARADCRQTKIWFPRINTKYSENIIKYDRQQVSSLVQLFTGHNYLKRHQALVDHSDDNLCRLCLEDEETSLHVMTECPALSGPRLMEFGPVQTNPPTWSVTQVTSFLRETSIGDLLRPEG